MNHPYTNNKPKVHLLAYGGTIACFSEKNTSEFYDSPTVDIQTLISEIPAIKQYANVYSEQVTQMISHEMTLDDLLGLAKRIDGTLRRDDVDGVVITQGTNCIEESAYFVSLVVNAEKPIVFTGAMRSYNALGFDGLRNLYNAILIASAAQSKKLGAVLSFNDVISCARDTTKQNASSVNGLSSNDLSILGYIQGDCVRISRIPNYKHTYCSEFNINNLITLPKTYLIYGYLGSDGVLVDAAVANGAAGIISIGVGQGYQPELTTKALVRAVENGVTVVRCSRVGNTYVNRNPKLDDKYGFIAGGSLSPQKARILLAVALNHTSDRRQIQKYFNDY